MSYTLDDLRKEVALMRAEQEFFTAAILAVVTTTSPYGNQHSLGDNTSWAITRAKELAAMQVQSRQLSG